MPNTIQQQLVYRKTVVILCSVLLFWQLPVSSLANIFDTDNTIWKRIRSHLSLKVDRSLEAETLKQIKWHKKHPNAIREMTENAKMYLAYVLEETDKRELPSEIALIPFVESNYDPFARSIKGASGLWQIMPDLASANKLEISATKDERRDVIKSTQTALNQLIYLKKRLYGRWDYAIAAYNAGEGRIRHAIRQSNRTNNKIPWTAFLPEQTRKYLPKIYALKAIINDPKKHGIKLPYVRPEVYFATTPTNRVYAFSQISEICSVNQDLLHQLNAQWKGHNLTPSHDSPLLVPRQKMFSCRKKLKKTPLFTNKWVRHKVKRSDSVQNIAWLYNTTPELVMSYNGLVNDNIQINDQLIIRKNCKKKPVISHNSSIEAAILAKEELGPRQINHLVKNNETIHTISKLHKVKVAHIAYWNRLKYPYIIKKGQPLVIWKNDLSKKSYVRYVVQPGDTMSEIARKHRSTTQKIMQASNIKNACKLRAYQVVTIPK